MNRLRIAQVAPLAEAVPPLLYGGTERVVSCLTEGLVERGHDVTLFASGDSRTHARLEACAPRALRLDPACRDRCAHHVLMLERVIQQAAKFDLIHYHVDYLHFPFSRRSSTPHVTTLHGRLDLPDLVPIFREFCEMPLVSISNAQRRPLDWANWQATIYHGLPSRQFQFHPERGTYLAFLGRVSPEKRLDRAIEIAERVGMPLRIAAKIEGIDQEYYDAIIAPLLRRSGAEFVGEISEDRKSEFLGNAAALLFPIDWPEPFGLVMIEAMACGTPTIAYRRGSVPEVISDGETGFIVSELDEAVAAVRKLPTLSRECCRQTFEQRFSAERMANDYLTLYERLCSAPARRRA